MLSRPLSTTRNVSVKRACTVNHKVQSDAVGGVPFLYTKAIKLVAISDLLGSDGLGPENDNE